MYKKRFLHHKMCFGIVVDDWGDAAGPEIAAAQLENWVKGLSFSRTEAIHRDLVKSDNAYGDDPIWETPHMLALCEARTAARQAGMAASGDDVNDGHSCSCQLIPITNPS